MRNRTVLITGASSGIGKALKDVLTGKGHTVYGTSRNGTPPASFGSPDTDLLRLDVTDGTSVRDAVALVTERESGIDVLVNNAGYAIYGRIADTPPELVREQFETNFIGTHRMTHVVLPHMLKRHSGRIIFIGSIAGRGTFPKKYFYGASKAALANYCGGLRFELHGTGIDATLVEPGYVATGFSGSTVPVNDAAADERQRTRTGVSRTPEQVAGRIARIINARTLRPGYVIGSEAHLFRAVSQILPRSLLECFTRAVFSKHFTVSS